MLQVICTLLIFLVIMFPIGRYLYHITTHKKTFADPVFDLVDNTLYKMLKIDTSQMEWKKYAMTLLLVNTCLVFVGYLILRIQSIGIFNPNGISFIFQHNYFIYDKY